MVSVFQYIYVLNIAWATLILRKCCVPEFKCPGPPVFCLLSPLYSTDICKGAAALCGIDELSFLGSFLEGAPLQDSHGKRQPHELGLCPGPLRCAQSPGGGTASGSQWVSIL